MDLRKFKKIRKSDRVSASIIARENPDTEETPDTTGIFRYTSSFKFYWELWIILLAVWNALYIPVDIAFEPSISDNPLTIAFNALIDFNFFLDILFTFRTTYYDKHGDEIYDWKKIGKKYLKGRFFIDFISTVPFDLIGGIGQLQILQLLKLLRLSRISKIIKNLSKGEANSNRLPQ